MKMGIETTTDYTTAPATVEDFNALSPSSGENLPVVAQVIRLGSAEHDALVLQIFLQKIGMSQELFDSLPAGSADWFDSDLDHHLSRGSSQADIRRAAESHFKKVKWDGDRKLAHDESKAITSQFGLKYIHLQDPGITVAYQHVPLDKSDPDGDWVVVMALASSNVGEPYCRKEGRAFAARRFVQNRRIAFNTSALPGYSKAEPVRKEAWKGQQTKLHLVDAMIDLVRLGSALFGRRHGNKEDDGATPEGLAAAKALKKARRQRIRAAEKALEEARNS